MNLEKLLDKTAENEWVFLERGEENYYGRKEEVREYTEEQRDEIKEVKDDNGRAAAKEYAAQLEPKGEIIKYKIGDKVEINPMKNVTHVKLGEDFYKERDLSELIVYTQKTEQPENTQKPLNF